MALNRAFHVRLDDEECEKLEAAAKDMGLTLHGMARLIIQNYLAGWTGPYVMRRPLHEEIFVDPKA